MQEKHQQLRDRTKSLSFAVIRLVTAMPRSQQAQIFGKQLVRSATSVAANYRAVNCCRTKAEFINKLRVVLEEADETVYWLECIREANLADAVRVDEILDEARQIAAIFTASLRTARGQNKTSCDDQVSRFPDLQISRSTKDS
jgi:four helix bundle protein